MLRKLVARPGAETLGGSYTEEIRSHGERCGFRLATFRGAARMIARVDFPKAKRVGKYGVDTGCHNDLPGGWPAARAAESASFLLKQAP